MFIEVLNMLSGILFFALNVINSGSFPQPLSAQKELEYLIDFRERGDTAARSKLIEHNLRLVAHIIKKYYNASGDQEDLISIGTIGLIKAVETFDYKKGVRLATYASRCIENEILMHFRNLKKTAQDVFISDPIDTDKEGNAITLMDIIADETNIVDDIDKQIKFKLLSSYLKDVLTPRERIIVCLRYRNIFGCVDVVHVTVNEENKTAKQLLHNTLTEILREARLQQQQAERDCGSYYQRNYFTKVNDNGRIHYEIYKLDAYEIPPLEYTGIDLVCRQADGRFIHPQNIIKQCTIIGETLEGLEGFHFHRLRHTYTSNLLSLGATPKEVQELLGHSDVNMTLNVYAHAARDSKRNCVKLLDKLETG